METQLEQRAEKLLAALRIAKPAFPQFTGEQILETLSLCEQNGGLFSNKNFLLAYFRYHPGERIGDRMLGDIVAEEDGATLKRLDLRDGPVVHMAIFVAPPPAGKMAQTVIDALNPWGISRHTRRRDKTLFHVKQNPRWRKP